MEILEARVIQKVGTEAEWLANPLPLLDGEAAIVRRADGMPVNLKFGLDGKTFAELPYFIDYSQAAYIAYEATPTQPIAYTFVGEGTYGAITVADGYMAVLGWDGTNWSKNAEIELPQPTGTDVITPSGDDLVTEKAVRDYSATKTDLLSKADVTVETGKNKFNKATVTTGAYMMADGTITSSATNVYSAPIPVELNVEYRFRSAINNAGLRFLCALDADLNPIPTEGSNAGLSSKTFTNPLVKYMIVSVNVNGVDDFQIEIGSVSTPYEPYTEKKVIDPSQIPSNVRTEEVKIIQNDLSFAELKEGSNNLANIYADDVTINGFLNNSGNIVSGDGTYNTTGFIDITKAGQLYVTASRHRFSAFYDANKNFIAGSYNSTSGNNITLTKPSGAVFLRISVPVSSNGVPYWEPLMVNYGNVALPWEQYQQSYYLLKNVAVEDGGNVSDEILLFLPETIYCAVGRTIEIYNSQCAWAGNLDDYHFLWSGVGKSMGRKWSVTGTSGSIGNYTLTLRVFNNAMKQVAMATSTVNIVTDVIASAFSINPIGDSLTNTKAWQPELISLSGGQISYQGTRGVVQSGVARTHEGRSGAKASYYIGNNSYTFDTSGQVGNDGRTQNLNPYWNPNTSAIDWSYYKSNYDKNPDKIMIWLGTNGIALDPAQNVADIKTFVDGLRASGASTVPMYIVLTLYRGPQDGIGNQTGSDGYVANSSWKLEEDRKVFNLQVALYEELKGYPNLHFIPLSLCHDSEYNYIPNGNSTPVNPRSWITYPQASEAIHPQLEGYNQIADVMFSVFAGTQ